MSKKVCDQIVEFLTHIGVERIYGIPGDTIDSLMEALRKQDKIKFIVMRHEEAGAFAASCEALLTEKLAVCVACQGPGAVHLLNGLYDAKLSKVPVLAITGQVNSTLLGQGQPQEINQTLLFDDVAIFNQEIRNPDHIVHALISACQAASIRHAVAHLCIPQDVIEMKASTQKINYEIFYEQYDLVPKAQDCQAALKTLAAAKKITILYGNGARDAIPELRELSKKLCAPLVHTTRSVDMMPTGEENVMGGIGLMGSRPGNEAVQCCEVLFVIGSSFAFEEYYPKDALIIQLDRNPLSIGKHAPIKNILVGDTKQILQNLLPQINQRSDKSFLQSMIKYREDHQRLPKWEARKTANNKAIHPQALTELVSQKVAEDAVICADVGEVTVWVNNFFKFTGKQRFVWSANLASLGTGLPYAIGAKLVYPDRQVVCLAGDGGFNMLLGDFATLIKYQLPVLFIIFNNSEFGFIELEQQSEGNPSFGTKLKNPVFAEVAKAFGGDGEMVRDYEKLAQAIDKGLASKVPYVIDVAINPDEMIIPPIITAKMALAFGESKLKTWFSQKSLADQPEGSK